MKMDAQVREERREKEEKLENQATTDNLDHTGKRDLQAEMEETVTDTATSSPSTVGPIGFQRARQTLTPSGKASATTKTLPVQLVSLTSVSFAHL